MAAEPLVSKLKDGGEYLSKIGAIIMAEYNRRISNQPGGYNAKDLADNIKDNAYAAIDRLVGALNELNFKDYKRDKSGDVEYFSNIRTGSYATVKNASTGEIFQESKVVRQAASIDGKRGILVEYITLRPFGTPLYNQGVPFVWNDDIGGWQTRYIGGTDPVTTYLSEAIPEKILITPDINSTIYTIEFSPTPSPQLQKVLDDYAAGIERQIAESRRIEAERVASMFYRGGEEDLRVVQLRNLRIAGNL